MDGFNRRTLALFVAPGIRPFAVATGWGLGKSGKELAEQLTKGYEAARPSGWDPAERIKDQEIDGVAAEVLYATLGMPLFALDDVELQPRISIFLADYQFDKMRSPDRRGFGCDWGGAEVERRWVRRKNGSFSSRSTALCGSTSRARE